MPAGVYERRTTPVRDRLLSRREIDPTTGCWLWLGAVQPNGYGMIGVGQRSKGTKKKVYTHRISYEVHVGPIPDGCELDHLCRVRRCFNPSHLEPVTRSENNLRGDGPAMLGALNGAKTHCRHGHAFTTENTYYRPTGGRTCRQCQRDRRNHVAD